MNSEIDKALGVVEDIEINPIVEKKVNPIQTSNNDADIENDYAYQRQNFYNLVERGSDAIEGILELARESDAPRACCRGDRETWRPSRENETSQRSSKQRTEKCHQCFVCREHC